MDRKKLHLLLCFSLFLLLFVFTPKAVNAQSCQGSLSCYKKQCSTICSGSGIACDPILTDCGGGQICGTSCNFVPDGSLNCSDTAQPVGTCQDASIGCMDSNGVGRSVQCSNPSAPSCTSDGSCQTSGLSCCTGTSHVDSSCASQLRCGPPAGGGGGGGGTCGSCSDYCAGAGQCGSQGGSIVGSRCSGGSCAPGTSPCLICSGGGGGPPPGYNTQGAFVYCQDGNGQIYPMPGLGINVSQTKADAPYNSGPNLTATTDSTGKAFFSTLLAGYVYAFTINGTVYGNPPTTHPLWFATSTFLPTGQAYSSLTVGDNGSMVNPASCNTANWTLTHCGAGWGRVCGWYCAPGLGTGGQPQQAMYYSFEVPSYANNSQYNAIWRFGNCTPPPPPGAWWQATGGDVITNGNLQSQVPSGSKFILDGGGGFPGNAIFAATTNLTKTNVSSKGWLGNILYQGKTYNSTYFNNIVPSSVTFNTLGSSVTQSDFTFGAASNGYYWYKSNGDLTITGNISIAAGRKIILFVNGNLNINGKINIASIGQAFFMTVVTGNINVAGAVTGNPTLEGIYEADGAFNTGSSNSAIAIRGTVVAYGGVSLQRNLQAANATTPAETIQYAPDLIMLYPRDLVSDRSNWQEVIP